MKPTEDLVNEHKSIKAMLGIMKRIADHIHDNKGADANDLEQIIDFIRVFADKCHHGKEEDALFPAMVEAGLPRHSGPIAVMFADHEMGRKYVRDLENAVNDFKAGKSEKPIETALINYVDLLRGHILKEESILFPMADRIVPEMTQEKLAERFEAIEEQVIGRGVHEQYHRLLERLKVKYDRP